MKNRRLLALLFFLSMVVTHAMGQRTEVKKTENVVYGMISGMALLMDVYQPPNSNHMGVLFINGSAWGYWGSYQKIYNQTPLKDDYYLDSTYGGKWAHDLVSKGYTVFFINHRFAPRYHYPDMFYDCQRAVRYIRYNAERFGISPDHIGAMGHSSGAYFSAMLGVTDTTITNLESPIDAVSSKVQAVVTLAAPFSLSDLNKKSDTAMDRNLGLKLILNYMNELPEERNGEFVMSGAYRNASPIAYTTKDDAAFLIYYSDDDPLFPSRQAVDMYRKLAENKVPVKAVLKSKEGHNPEPDMVEVDKWFKQYLK